MNKNGFVFCLTLMACFITQAQQGTINFYDSSTGGINSIGPHDSNTSIRINGEKNVDVVIDEGGQYSDGAFNIYNDGPSPSPLFQIKRDGNVGVGRTASNYKLDVNGNIRANEHITVQENGSYRISLNGQGDGYIVGRNNLVENKFYINSNGNSWFNGGKIGIGTTTPDAKLAVNGKIHAEEIKVDLSVPGPDYVFKEGYALKSLEEVQNYINEHGHLPNIPSTQVMEENGIQLGEMNMKLLEKIEEQMLYIIQLRELLELQGKELEELKMQLNKVE